MKSWVLIPDMALFGLVSLVCLAELLHSQRQLTKDPDASTLSAGTEMKRRIQVGGDSSKNIYIYIYGTCVLIQMWYLSVKWMGRGMLDVTIHFFIHEWMY